MFSGNYKTIKSVLSILFVFSMLFSPFYYSVNTAFADEEGTGEELTTDVIVESEPVIEDQETENNESEETEDLTKNSEENSEEVITEETPAVEPESGTNNFSTFSAVSADYDGCASDCEQIFVHTCALPNSLGDSTVEPLVQGWDSMSLQDVFNSLLIDRSVIGDQKQYQTWDAPNSTTTISIEFTNKISALNHVFGYYRNNDLSTFVPIFRSGLVTGFESVPEFSFGQSATLDVVGAGSIGFAIKTSDGNTYATTNALNENGNDHAVAYDWADNTYYVSFEDLALGVSDVDYNDVTVKLTVNGCQDAPENPYCPDGGDMSYDKFIEARNAGLISFDIATSTDSAYVNFSNQTGCTAPMSLSSYKMFVNPGESNWLSTQQLFDSTGIISATSSTFYEVSLPTCKVQIDFWYGLAPTTLLDSNPYGAPPPPVVVDWEITDGNLCIVSENTPPTITLIGDNPLNINVDTAFVDPGATATDTEDGNLTDKIVVTGSVATSTVGTYTLTYVVKDSGNLYATTTRTVNVNPVIVPPVNPPVTPPGGGGGGIGGHRHPVGEILGATTCSYLRDYLKIDWENDKVEVLKLQYFLNVFEKENLSFTGTFDQTTFEAVQRFQTKYSEDILEPWGDKVTTGFVYILTKKKVNEIYCNTIYPLSQVDQSEIDTFRNSDGTGSGTSVGGSTGSSQNYGTDSATDLVNKNEDGSPVVELKDDSKNQSVIRNAAISLFALSQKMFSDIKYLVILLIILAVAAIITRLVYSKDSDNTPIIPVAKTDDKKEQITKTESPTIALPGVLPDEEIIIENPEEGPEEVLVTTPDLRDDKKTN